MAGGLTEPFLPNRGLDELLAAYLEEAEAGQSPDRRAWLARHPEWADELSSFFANLDLVGRLAAPFRSPPDLIPFPGAGAFVSPGARIGYIGDYELIRVIGRGGMGIIYEARQASLDRVLALKLIAGGGCDPASDLRRFRREAEAAAQLDHPNIVTIHEIGSHQGQAYLSMTLVDGGSLADHSRRLRDDPRGSARVVATIALAVDYAHRRGVLHRDLKPANILLDRQGTPHVADFGLARRSGSGDVSTIAGTILGTPAYMAPEQAEGRREAVTTAVDVYGLGAILYELLTGRPPFQGDSALDVLRQVRECDPDRPRSIEPNIPRDLETICLKCLEKDPARRYESAGAMARDLNRWRAGEPIAARRASTIERLAKWARRRPAVAALVLACLVAVGAAAAAGRSHRSAERWRAEVVLRDQDRDRARVEDYLRRIAAAHRAWLANDVKGAERLLDGAPARLRRWEWHYLNRLCRSELRTLRGHDGVACSVAFAPSSSLLNCPDHRGGLSLWDAEGGREVGHLRGHDGSSYGVAFDRWGTRLAAAGSDGAVRLWDLASERLIRTLPGHGEWASAVAFSPDGMQVASGGADRVVRIWDTATGAELMALRGHSGAVFGVAFSPDGNRIASAGQDGAVVLWDARAGREERRLPAHSEAARCVAFRPDGARLASGGADRAVRVWDVATGREILAFQAADGRVDGLSYSPDGLRLATGGLDRSVRVWDAGTGRAIASYRGHEAPVFGVAFSPDGLWLASAGQDAVVKLWDATTGPEARSLRAGDGVHACQGLGFGRDGTVIAAGADGSVASWTAATGRPGQTIAGHERIAALAIDLSGQWLAVVAPRGTIRLLDATTGEERRTLRADGFGLASVAFSPDGSRVIAGEGPALAVVQGLRGKGVPPSPEGRSVRVWDVASGGEVFALKGHEGSVFGVAASPDGLYLASAGADGMVRLWDAATGRELGTFRGHAGPSLAVAFSPDGSTVASAGADGTVRLWNHREDGRPLFVTAAHSGWALGVAFSPDGSRLASGGADGAVKILDARTGREYLSLAGQGGRVHGVAFGPDGTLLATGSDDGSVRIWDARLPGKPPPAGPKEEAERPTQ